MPESCVPHQHSFPLEAEGKKAGAATAGKPCTLSSCHSLLRVRRRCLVGEKTFASKVSSKIDLGLLGGWTSAAPSQQRPTASQSLTSGIFDLSSQRRRGRRRLGMRLLTGWNSPEECPLILRRSICLGVSLETPLRVRHASSSPLTKVRSLIKSRRLRKDEGKPAIKTAGKLGRRVTRGRTLPHFIREFEKNFFFRPPHGREL